MDGTVLVADDDRTIRTVLTQALTRAGCKVHATSSIETLMRWIREGMGDLVISDVVMPDGNGLEALPEIARIRPGLPVIVISAQNTIMTAIRATEARAYDYLPKPFDLPDLMKRAARALRVKRRRVGPAATASAASPREAPAAGPDGDLAVTGGDCAAASRPADEEDRLPLVGRTPRMQALYRLVAGVINTSLPVLVRGPSGSGKSLIARAIHDFGNRRQHAFVVADMLDFARPEDLRRLFGQARNGTLLIEEVGDIPLNEQGRLARLLDRPEAGSIRILSTTRADLPARIREGSFREDLYYRLCGVEIGVPELRDRIEDIPLLARHFLARAQAHAATAVPGGTRLHLGEAAIEALCRYSWPGNVRQLEHAINRLAATVAGPEIGCGDVEQLLHSQPGDDRQHSEGGDVQPLSDAVARHLRRYFDLHQGALPPPGLHGRILREVERPLIEIALEATTGNQARCAALLGINRNTLRKKIADLDIRVTRGRKLM